MWFKHRLKRVQSKWRHLRRYFKTLPDANEIERLTDFENCQRPVLLLYGFGATRRSVSILETRLRKDGFGVFSVKLGGFLDCFNTAPIDTVAEKIAEKIENLCRRYRLPKMSIIGYSKGGLIGRYYVSHLNGEKRVHTLITLATPHRGNPWTWLTLPLLIGCFSRGLRQMVPASPFMRRLAKTPIPLSVYAVSIYSSLDKTCPQKYSRLPEGLRMTKTFNICLPHLHHSDFVIKQSAYEEIYKHLMEGLHCSKNVSTEEWPPSPPQTAKR